jgi:capsule polysaccharide export protein KpsE/RkpR
MTAEKIPSWIERLLMPLLGEIKGELKAINTKIDALESNMNAKFEGVDIKISSLDERIASLRNETKTEFTGLNYRLDSLEKRIPVIEKITALEIKIAELEKRLAVA